MKNFALIDNTLFMVVHYDTVLKMDVDRIQLLKHKQFADNEKIKHIFLCCLNDKFISIEYVSSLIHKQHIRNSYTCDAQLKIILIGKNESNNY